MLELLPPLLDGAWLTVRITAVASLLAAALALAAGLARLSAWRPVRALAAVYVETFRGTSLLVQLFWLYFVLPLPPFSLELDAFTVAVLGLGLNIGAYGAEVVRSAIQAVPRSQIEASVALNMTPALRMRRIVLPQAALAMLPPWGNLMIELLKGTSLVSLITLGDLTFRASQLNAFTFRTVEIFTLVLVIYFLLAQAIALAVRAAERRLSRGIARRTA
ncbi:ectoine/hydroxyectoine ABC transporter permease subunit EhuC [Arenibaculum sp.]|jgi:polar amino acid transport system permease protein|uniref:ectoine/hydroxyectoine ABC transporter permease subunit EhuC n=1 Tax=Arenibaculum sp. TaxID=2865862 RepID=UPI002E132AEA|nr:ectoine/hydroxyectoine ABC transporter permease subunit EhuC [Arenibaculum sp.]